MRAPRPALALLASLAAQLAFAQLPMLDATLVDNGNNQLEVRVRPDATFDGLFSSVVFTIRWDASSGANLGPITAVSPADEYMNVIKSGGETDDMGGRYQVFAGFGFTPLNAVPLTWDPGVEYALMTIPVLNGTSTFELVNDGWTAANNADYYVSLNGQDRTGVYYQLNTGGVTMGSTVSGLQVLPNPTEGLVTLSFNVELARTVDLEVLNSLGQKVHAERLPSFSGAYRRTLDLGGFGSGVYVLNLRTSDGLMTQRIVVR